MIIDLTELPTGNWYEDRYRGYLNVFEQVARTPLAQRVTIVRPPYSWVPLLWHLQVTDIIEPTMHFAHCKMVSKLMVEGMLRDRTAIEVLTNFRPETADALWKIDVGEWSSNRVRQYGMVKEFIVTTNGSFHRPEVMDYMRKLETYRPTKKKVVLCPCAADKPYPAPLHQKILDMLPNDYYLANVTGVLGIVPQDLWGEMCWYDSGIPNRWRAMTMVMDYFTRNAHEKVVVYSDFYALAIRFAFDLIGQRDRVHFVIPPVVYDNYLDLMNTSYLEHLRDEFEMRG